MVCTVEGIFRKLGDREARQFIRDYVSSQAATKPTQASVINFLEMTRPKYGEDRTLADAAIEAFNAQEATAGAIGGEPDMGQLARY